MYYPNKYYIASSPSEMYDHNSIDDLLNTISDCTTKTGKTGQYKYNVGDAVWVPLYERIGTITARRLGNNRTPYYKIDIDDRIVNIDETDVMDVETLMQQQFSNLKEAASNIVSNFSTTIETQIPDCSMNLNKYDSGEPIKTTQNAVDDISTVLDHNVVAVDELHSKIDELQCVQNDIISGDIHIKSTRDAGFVDDRFSEIESKIVDIEKKQKKHSKLAKLAILGGLV